MQKISKLNISDPLLTAAEAAEYLRIHRKTLYRITRKGQVSSMRTPGGRIRYRLSDLDAYMQGSGKAFRREDSSQDINWGE